MKKISKEDKEEWLKELRNPENIKGKYVLRDSTNVVVNNSSGKCYCALGLLCKATKYIPKSWYNCYPIQEIGPDRHALPKPFKGLTPEQQIEISSMNDNLDKSFEEIAQWVETNIIPRKTS